MLIYEADCPYPSSTLRALRRRTKNSTLFISFQFIVTIQLPLSKQQCSEETKNVETAAHINKFLDASYKWVAKTAFGCERELLAGTAQKKQVDSTQSERQR